MSRHLDRILTERLITTYHQPIFDLASGEIRAVEALSRGPAGNLEAPDLLFSYAQKLRRTAPLDLLCIEQALASAPRRSPSGKPLRLFVNLHADTLTYGEKIVEALLQRLRTAGVAPEELTIEVTEQLPVHDYSLFLGNIHRLRSAGAHIAIDDLGLGYSNLKLVIEIMPEYFKIDHYFISGIAADRRKRKMVEMIRHMADGFGIMTIAEGVETPAELAVLRELKIPWVQGFLLAGPRPAGELPLSMSGDGGRSATEEFGA